MADKDSSQFELDELRRRWLETPTPQFSMRLAEQYRRRDRRDQAVEVLEEALQQNPDHLGARVALGRYRVEMGELEKASEELELVVREDPTNLVANKLLVNLHLDMGRPRQARDRLDLYKLLNAGDPEIEFLEARFPATPVVPEEAAAQQAAAEQVTAEEVTVPDLAAEDVPAEEAGWAEIETDPAAETPPEENDLFSLGALPPPPVFPPVESPETEALDSGGGEPDESEAAPGDAAEPFPGLSAGLEDSALWELSGAEAIFDLGPPREAVTTSGEAEQLAASSVAVSETAVPQTPADAVVEALPSEVPVEDTGIADAAIESELPSEPTATLGRLYFDQGHLDEAESTYRELLERDPESRDALAGLAMIKSRREGWLTAGELMDTPATETASKQRKVRLLTRYLDRLRSGAERP